MRVVLTLAVALLGLQLTVPAVSAEPMPSAAAAAKKKGGKGKKRKCKRGKVAVRVNRRRLCQSPRAALPRPKPADQRLLAAQAALSLDLGKIRDRRGRRAVSVAKLLGPKKTKTAALAIRRGLTTVDRLQSRRALTSIAAASARGCGGGRDAQGLTQSFAGSGFDGKVDFDSGTAQIGVDVGTSGIRAEIDLGLCEAGGDKFRVPECPDAQGRLEASDESLMFVALRVIRGGELILSQRIEFTADTEIKPIQVDDDAKLEYFDLEHTYRTSVNLGGSSQAFGPIRMRLTYHGSTRVNFPGATYDPTHTDVDVSLSVAGAQADELHEIRDLEFDQALRAKREANKNFAAEVDKAIARITDRERGWQQPNKCAKVEFEPASGTLTLERGQAGSLRARVDSKQGGAPQGAKWSLLDAQNATISPGKALANPATFGYSVTNAGEGIAVRGTFKAVSQAGVAEGTWTQPTKKKSTIAKIAGTFNLTIDQSGSVFKWSGNATFDRFTPPVLGGANGSFKLSSGLVTVTASGKDMLFSPLCSQKGSGEFALLPTSEFFAIGAPPEFGPPYEYSIAISTSALPLPEIEIELFNCTPPADTLNGETFSLPVPLQFNPTGSHFSPDGFNYEGSESAGEGGVAIERDWLFHGTE